MIGISLSTYHYEPKTPRPDKAIKEADLIEAIANIRAGVGPNAGYRTLQHYLSREYGIKLGERRLRNFIRRHGPQAKHKKLFVRTTMSDHDELVHPNLLPEMQVTDVNQVWVADLTNTRVLTSFVYLACVLEVYSRKDVG